MPLSAPRILFGIHSISPYRRSDKMPYGILKVVGSGNLALSSDIEQLFAGSNKFAWAAEAKTVSAEISAKVKAYPGFLFELFLGATVTDSGVDAAGTVSAVANALGTSAVAATGLASVTVIPTTGAANLKFGRYTVKVMSATTIKVYLSSDAGARGTSAPYIDDTLEVSGPHTITIGGTTDVASLGLRFTGGASAIAMTTGDTATFEVVPPSSKSSLIKVGGSADTFPEFGADMLAQKRATGELFEVRAFKCVGSGLPISMEENAFSQPELKAICQYDSVEDAVFKIRHYVP
jgi:hypothetical protein